MSRDFAFVRSYIIKNGHLFLSLMADGGVYEFEPMGTSQAATPKSPVAFRGPFRFECTQAGRAAGTLTATFYQTVPAMVLVERGNQTRPAFQVRAASGAKYEGQSLMFWEAHGEVQLAWSGVDLKCKRR